MAKGKDMNGTEASSELERFMEKSRERAFDGGTDAVELHIDDRFATGIDSLTEFLDGIRALSQRLEPMGFRFSIERQAIERRTVIRLEKVE